MPEYRYRITNYDHFGLYRRLLEIRAQSLREVLVKRLIRKCQAQTVGLMGSAGLKNLWEEICIAMRDDHPLKDRYEDHLKNHLEGLIQALPALDQQTLWLLARTGDEFLIDADDLKWPDQVPRWETLQPSDWPLDTRRLAIDIIHDDVLYECYNYDNARIRAYEGR